jgi:flagellar L-ring protein precursor FlgH
MKRRDAIIVGLFLTSMLGAHPAPAEQATGSLWDEASVPLFANRKATAIGDVVTVIIVEEASASNQTQMKLTKENSVDMSGEGSGKLDFIPLFGGQFDYTKEHQGKGQTSLSGRMSARVTAMVVEILPNGNLVIEGSRNVRINEDTDQITLRGVVRPEDIRADNTVLSTYLADAQISYTGSGPSKNAGKQGIIARLLDLLF